MKPLPSRFMPAAAALFALVALVALLGLAWPGPARAQDRDVETYAERRAVLDVRDALADGDCRLASARLNKGLAAKLPAIYVMAGTMFEEGLCLKPDWDRAVSLYLRADEAGHRASRLKLVAGYAYRQRDLAAAMWWAQQASALPLPDDCRVPDWLTMAPETFVLTLQRWPAERLRACVYVAGVLATVAGDMQYPPVAMKYNLVGQVGMRFVPAQARFDWRTIDVEAVPMTGVVRGEDLLDGQSSAARKSLETYLRESGQRALRRYEAPAGLNPNWQLDTSFAFQIFYR